MCDKNHNYDSKDPQGWLLKLKDYLSGRTQEVDDYLTFVENQIDTIDNDDNDTWDNMRSKVNSMWDQEPKEVSRQLWALLAALVQDHPETHLVFRNVARHHGAEAWRRITEPILQGRDLRRKHFQPRVLRPRPAQKVDDIPGALEQWESDYRLFKDSGGAEMED